MCGHLHMQVAQTSVITGLLETCSGLSCVLRHANTHKQVLYKDTSDPKYTNGLAGGHVRVSGPHRLH